MTTMSSGRREQLNLTPTTNSKMICTSCQKHKYQLRTRKSKLNGMQMYLCNGCFENKYEPRWLVIIVAQEDKDDPVVRDCLLNHKYVGSEIPAADLIK